MEWIYIRNQAWCLMICCNKDRTEKEFAERVLKIFRNQLLLRKLKLATSWSEDSKKNITKEGTRLKKLWRLWDRLFIDKKPLKFNRLRIRNDFVLQLNEIQHVCFNFVS